MKCWNENLFKRLLQTGLNLLHKTSAVTCLFQKRRINRPAFRLAGVTARHNHHLPAAAAPAPPHRAPATPLPHMSQLCKPARPRPRPGSRPQVTHRPSVKRGGHAKGRAHPWGGSLRQGSSGARGGRGSAEARGGPALCGGREVLPARPLARPPGARRVAGLGRAAVQAPLNQEAGLSYRALIKAVSYESVTVR